MAQAKYLSAKSAELMSKAAEHAIELAERGVPPDEAVVKSAHIYKLSAPLAKHVAYAFNIGQSARVRSMSADAWTKASTYHISDPDNVFKLMTSGNVDTETVKKSSDFRLPPTYASQEEVKEIDMSKVASYFGVEYTKKEHVKKSSMLKISSVQLEKPEGSEDKPLTEFQLKCALAKVTDAARAVAKLLPMPEYKGAKKLAVKMYPYMSPIMFKTIDNNGITCKESSDNTEEFMVPVNHKLVSIAAKFEKLATEFVNRFSKHKYNETLLTDVLKPEHRKLAAYSSTDYDDEESSPAPAKKTPSWRDRPAAKAIFNTLQPGASSMARMYGIVTPGKNDMFRQHVDKSREHFAEQLAAKALTRNISAPLDTIRDVGSTIDEQTGINNLLQDEAFASVDPSEFFKVYKELSTLAPTAMKSPVIARQAMNLRLQTGPLDLFNAKTLAEIEQKLNQSRQSREDD